MGREREREREWKWGAGFEGLGDGWRRKRRFVEVESRRERERERERECVSGDYEPETLDRPAAPMISAGFRRLHMFARHLIFIDPYMIYVHGTPKKSCRVASALEGGGLC